MSHSDSDEEKSVVEEEEEENVLMSDEFDDAFFLDYSNFSNLSFGKYVKGRDVWKVWLLCDSDDFHLSSTTTSEESLSQVFMEMFYDDDVEDVEFSVEIHERCYLKAQDKWLAKMTVYVRGDQPE
jgi:hypothetical protein